MNLRKKRKERKHPIFQQLASSALFAQSAFICMCLVKCLQALSLDEFDYISTSKWGPVMDPLSGFAREPTAPEWVHVSAPLTDSTKKNITLQWPLLMQIILEMQLIRLEDHIFTPWHL